MESLLCNEVWPMSPNVVQANDGIDGCREDGPLLIGTEQDCEEAFGSFTDKEARYMPESGYLNLLLKNDLLRNYRFEAVNWLVKSQKGLNLSLGTVFIAVNCVDRFVSLSRCQGWKDWMFELLSIACLSVASKFNETASLPLCEFQGDGLRYSFAPSLIQRMELTLLKGLGWRLASTTPFSYMEILIQRIHGSLNKTLLEDSVLRVTELLISALLDPTFLEYRPCIIAVSAVRCVCEEFFRPTQNASLLVFLDTVISQDQDDLIKCQRSMKKLQDNNALLTCGNFRNGPSSPVTVLLKEELFNFCDCSVEITDLRSSKKRKREEEERGV